MNLVFVYLLAIVTANLLVANFGPSVTVINAFLLIGLDITSRDYLHERWKRQSLTITTSFLLDDNGQLSTKHLHLCINNLLWPKMLALIAAGSILSYALNANAGPIALASFVAFSLSGVADTLTYWLLGDKSRFVKINGSNVVSAAVDSFAFPALAFGFPLLWSVIIGQFVAKVAGGFVWSLILSRRKVVAA